MTTEKIEPALTGEEWADVPSIGYFDWGCGIVDVSYQDADYQNLPAKLIALANAALPADDPRKITRERVEWIRWAADAVSKDPRGEYAETDDTMDGARATLRSLADALASYLPPE